MDTEDTADRRLKFYGLNDHGTFFQVERAAEILEHYDPSFTANTISDILELHNAQLFAESNLFPKSYTDSQRAACQALIPELRKKVAKFFNAMDDANIASIVVDVDLEYHADLLQLLSQYKVYDRCASTTTLPVLEQNRIGVGEMLTSQYLVRSYDQEVRARLVSDSVNAEHLIRKYLEKDARRNIYLPPSFTSDDARALLNDYLDSDDANPNFIELISLARVKKDGVVDAKMKLKARRKHKRWAEEFFKKNSGIKTGCEVTISAGQTEPVEVSTDGPVTKFSYSRRWLEDNLDYPTIFNNFLYLFEFTDRRMLLTLPLYHAQLGVFERFMKTTGKDSYPVGVAFHFEEQSSFLQTAIYDDFLRTRGIALESAIAWFFSDYMKDEFGAANFRFTPSSSASTYLEKCRHIFAEMESVVRQFSLYVENGELDTGLLAITSEHVRYKEIPSLMSGKYVYPSSGQDIRNILNLLFSDQSGLTYISESLKADDAARLLISNQVAYGDFADHQKGQIDYLIQRGVLANTGQRVRFASASQFLVLKDLFNSEAVTYYHCPAKMRASIDEMVAKGWLVRRESLLTEPEASYFNYCLNQTEFSNGPDLRNKYLHGSQADADDEDAHFRTYITALKLLIALVIKINDDFCLRDDENTHQREPGSEYRA
jgi:hypothetical protein